MLTSFLCKGIQVLQVANAALLDDLGDALSAVADLAIRVAVVDSENATVQACDVWKEWRCLSQPSSLKSNVDKYTHGHILIDIIYMIYSQDFRPLTYHA